MDFAYIPHLLVPIFSKSPIIHPIKKGSIKFAKKENLKNFDLIEPIKSFKSKKMELLVDVVIA